MEKVIASLLYINNYFSFHREEKNGTCLEDKGNNKIIELRTILQRESQNS